MTLTHLTDITQTISTISITTWWRWPYRLCQREPLTKFIVLAKLCKHGTYDELMKRVDVSNLYKLSSTPPSKIIIHIDKSLIQKEWGEKSHCNIIINIELFDIMRFLAIDEVWNNVLKIRAWPLVCNIVEPNWIMGTKWPLTSMTWSLLVWQYMVVHYSSAHHYTQGDD